jgi:ABC-type lipoprotein release transport system permease subunit
MSLLLRLAVRNLLRHPLKTFLIGTLIAFGVLILFCANAVFESTTNGLKTSFVGSVTGDFAVGAAAEETYGLFGSEVPIVSEYEIIPPISEYAAVTKTLASTPGIESWSSLVSTLAQTNIGGYQIKTPVFGVEQKTYFEICDDILILSGNPTLLAAGGVFLNERMALDAEVALGRDLEQGEPVVFSVYSNGNFRSRKGTFAGVYRYPSPTEILDRIVLADPVIVRGLCNYTLGYALEDKKGAAAVSTRDIEDLFTDALDIEADAEGGLTLGAVESNLADRETRDRLIMTDDAAWSFVIVRVDSEASSFQIRRDVTRSLIEQRTAVRVMDWRTAAGSSALIVFAVRIAFNVGIAVLILGAILVVMNALVISVLERTNEIGSLRALGASRSFIRALFITETMTLTLAAAAVGVTVGVISCAAMARTGISLNNPLLAILFGDTVVRPSFGVHSIVYHLLGAAAIGSLAWIYPVSLALKIQPVAAMAERT